MVRRGVEKEENTCVPQIRSMSRGDCFSAVNTEKEEENKGKKGKEIKMVSS